MKILLLVALLMVTLTPNAFAEKPVFPFEKDDSGSRVDGKFQAFHPQFEDDKDYGESWFFLIQTDEGAMLFAMLSVTNLGLRTYDGIIDVQFYTPDGKKYAVHGEHKRDALKASSDKMDVKIANSRVTGGGMNYHMNIDEQGLKLNFDVKNTLPPYKFNNGKVLFYEDRSAEWTMGLNTPRGRSTGSLTVDGKTFNLAGHAYHDHGWATIKMPDAFQSWYTLRLYDKKYSIVFHKQTLDKAFGAKINQFGLFAVDNKIKGAMRNFKFTTSKSRKDPTSKYKIPIAFDVSFKANGYTVKGKVTESRFLEAIDVLGQVSWPVRVVIKAFYSNPYMHRYLAQYELDVTDPQGTTEHISGLCVVEANFF